MPKTQHELEQQWRGIQELIGMPHSVGFDFVFEHEFEAKYVFCELWLAMQHILAF